MKKSNQHDPLTKNRLVKDSSLRGGGYSKNLSVGATSSATASTSTFSVELLIPQIDTKALTDTIELSDHISQLLDGFDLLSQVDAFNEITHLRVTLTIGNLVQVQKRLVDIWVYLRMIRTCCCWMVVVHTTYPFQVGERIQWRSLQTSNQFQVLARHAGQHGRLWC